MVAIGRPLEPEEIDALFEAFPRPWSSIAVRDSAGNPVLESEPTRLWQFFADEAGNRVRTPDGKLVGMAVDDSGQALRIEGRRPALIELDTGPDDFDPEGEPLA
jgi:hypothetical protein